jgi:S-adenosylmethionine:tRNA ribosyltransferase-isomerase
LQAKSSALQPFDNIKLPEFTYDLPEDRIAAFPETNRDESLLLVRKQDGTLYRDLFLNLASYLDEGSHLVFNNSRVIPARLIFTKPTGSKIELFCLTPIDPSGYDHSLSSRSASVWECMAGNLKRFRSDELQMNLVIGQKNLLLRAERVRQIGGLIHIRFSWQDNRVTFAEILSAAGKTPLPPYIRREPDENDRERYQTVYAKHNGSVAAPTAGLHFTEKIFEKLMQKGISLHEITLHVGAGTFKPIKSDSLLKHDMHGEFLQVTRKIITMLTSLNTPVVAVGTTSVRTLESLYWLGVKILADKKRLASDLRLGQWEAYELPQNISVAESFCALDQRLDLNKMSELCTSTRLMIIPGYRFRVVNTLITNFHQPGSTLLLLVAAFMGKSWVSTYQYALDNGFRFLSYGDSSLLFR